MVKFKLKNKGKITQGFSNPNVIYKDRGGRHTGIDSKLGWDQLVTCDNDCTVYKVITSDMSKENWQGVYMLVPHGEAFIEICQGHFNKIFVKEGQKIVEGTYIGLEGNKGFVFKGGIQITPEMQKAGDQRGTHTHTSYRPTKRVKRPQGDAHYLLTTKGTKYKDDEGFYYEIIANGDLKGYIDPMIFEYKNSMLEEIKMLAKVLLQLKK